jgi:hypothetical protein
VTEFAPHDRVEVISDRLLNEGAPRGTIGYVIERWRDGALEIEVMHPDGSTAVQFVAQPSDLRHAPTQQGLGTAPEI